MAPFLPPTSARALRWQCAPATALARASSLKIQQNFLWSEAAPGAATGLCGRGNATLAGPRQNAHGSFARDGADIRGLVPRPH